MMIIVLNGKMALVNVMITVVNDMMIVLNVLLTVLNVMMTVLNVMIQDSHQMNLMMPVLNVMMTDSDFYIFKFKRRDKTLPPRVAFMQLIQWARGQYTCPLVSSNRGLSFLHAAIISITLRSIIVMFFVSCCLDRPMKCFLPLCSCRVYLTAVVVVDIVLMYSFVARHKIYNLHHMNFSRISSTNDSLPDWA